MQKTFIVFFLLLSYLLHGQDFTNSQNTVLSLRTYASDELTKRLDNYEPKTKREKENYFESKQFYDSALEEYTIAQIYTALTEKAGLKLEEKDALIDYIMYGDNGLPSILIPKSAIKKIVKKGHQTDYYFVFNINIGISIAGTLLPGTLKPEVKCEVKVFSPKKELVKKIVGKNDGKTAIRMKDFPHKKFDKLEIEYMELLVEKIKPMITEAVLAAAEKL